MEEKQQDRVPQLCTLKPGVEWRIRENKQTQYKFFIPRRAESHPQCFITGVGEDGHQGDEEESP